MLINKFLVNHCKKKKSLPYYNPPTNTILLLIVTLHPQHRRIFINSFPLRSIFVQRMWQKGKTHYDITYLRKYSLPLELGLKASLKIHILLVENLSLSLSLSLSIVDLIKASLPDRNF